MGCFIWNIFKRKKKIDLLKHDFETYRKIVYLEFRELKEKIETLEQMIKKPPN